LNVEFTHQQRRSLKLNFQTFDGQTNIKADIKLYQTDIKQNDIKLISKHFWN